MNLRVILVAVAACSALSAWSQCANAALLATGTFGDNGLGWSGGGLNYTPHDRLTVITSAGLKYWDSRIISHVDYTAELTIPPYYGYEFDFIDYDNFQSIGSADVQVYGHGFSYDFALPGDYINYYDDGFISCGQPKCPWQEWTRHNYMYEVYLETNPSNAGLPWYIYTGAYELNGVPEPQAWALLMSGFVLLGEIVRGRRRRLLQTGF